MSWGVVARLPRSLDGFGGLVWDLHANSGDIFAWAACATACLGDFYPISMAILRFIRRCYECADALQGLIYVGFTELRALATLLTGIGDLPVTGFGWLTIGGVLVQTSGGCIWCGVPAWVSRAAVQDPGDELPVSLTCSAVGLEICAA